MFVKLEFTVGKMDKVRLALYETTFEEFFLPSLIAYQVHPKIQNHADCRRCKFPPIMDYSDEYFQINESSDHSN
jgi:hypothetical protein